MRCGCVMICSRKHASCSVAACVAASWFALGSVPHVMWLRHGLLQAASSSKQAKAGQAEDRAICSRDGRDTSRRKLAVAGQAACIVLTAPCKGEILI